MEMTIEGFFLADYQRMRERIDELEAKVAEYEHNERTSDFGCFDLRKSVDAVYVRTAPSYEYRRDGMFTKDEAERLLDLGDDELFEWAKKTHHGKDRWNDLDPIEIRFHTYQYTLRFVESRSDKTFVTDGMEGSNLVEMSDEAALDAWVDSDLCQECVELALKDVRDNLTDVLGELGDE